MGTATEGMWSEPEYTKAAEASHSEQGAAGWESGGEHNISAQSTQRFPLPNALCSSELRVYALLPWSAAR